MDQARTTAVDCAGQEGHADGFLMSNSLESADEIGTLQILRGGVELVGSRYIQSELRVRARPGGIAR